MTSMQFETFLADSEATVSMGKKLGQALQDSPVRLILFFGTMGSGKTTMTRGLVQALPGGQEAEAASPSFSLCNWYDTSPPCLHADLFRCEFGDVPEELEETLHTPAQQQTLVLIEWAEYLPAGLASPLRLDIHLQTCQEGRLFFATAHGQQAIALCKALGLAPRTSYSV